MDSMRIKTGVLAVAIIVSGCGKPETEKIADNGFDQICNIYTEVFTDKKLTKLSEMEKFDIIDGKIRKTLTSVDAIETYVATASVNPADKYKIFKQSAEYSLKRSWDCPMLKTLNNQYVKKHNNQDKKTQ